MWQQAARQSKGPIELGVAWHLAEVTGTPTEEDAQPQPQRVAAKVKQTGLGTTSCKLRNVESERHHLCRQANPVRGVADPKGHFKSCRADNSQALTSEPCCAGLVLGALHQLTLLVMVLRTL